jgi:peptidyl-Lys metalloendopeptidase
MFRIRFAAALLALFGATAAGAGLRATLDVDKAWLGPSDDVVARVTVTNTGRIPVAVPRWQLPKGQMDADLFEVVQDGRPVDYVGRLAKRPAPAPGDFAILRPGQSLRGRTELTRHYDMHGGGEYVVIYRMDLLDGVDLDALRDGSETILSNAVTLWRDAAPVDRRIDWDALNAPAAEAGSLSTVNCSSSQASGVSSAYNGARNYSTESKGYLQGRAWSAAGPRYTTWFGALDSSRYTTVTNHFVSIEDAFYNKAVVVDCGCTQNYYAYVYKNQPYKIYVCNAFWSAPNTGTDSRSGTLIHEMSHFTVVADTDDWAYGQSACKKLAKRANKAIDNADSHEYFAENSPPLN